MAKTNEGLTMMFERFSKLMSEFQIHGKLYEKKDINMKFLLTLPEHLEHGITTLGDGRDMKIVSLEILYDVL